MDFTDSPEAQDLSSVKSNLIHSEDLSKSDSKTKTNIDSSLSKSSKNWIKSNFDIFEVFFGNF